MPRAQERPPASPTQASPHRGIGGHAGTPVGLKANRLLGST